MAKAPKTDRAGGEQRQRFLRMSLWVLIGFTAFIILSPMAAPWVTWPWSGAVVAVMAASSIFYLIAYWRLSGGHSDAAARWLVVGIMAASIGSICVPGGIEGARSFAFITNNVLIAAFVLSWRAGAVVGAVDALALGALAWTRSGYLQGRLVEDLVILFVVSALILTFAAYSESILRANKASQATLRHTVSDMRALLDNGPDAMLTVRGDGEVLRLNDVAREWAQTHLHRDVKPGDQLRDLLGDPHWEQVAPLAADAMHSTGVSSEMTFHGTHGPIWLQLHLRHIEGTDDAFAVQIRNATQGRQIEMRERVAYRDRMELEKLREIDRFRSRLLNMASHEMRTPMTPLRLQLGVLERRMKDVMDERTQHSFATIKRNVSRLTMLLDDLLDVAKLEANEMHLKPVLVDVDNLVRNETDVHRPLAESKGLKLATHSHAGAQIRADPHRLAQVFSNLLSNAIKYARAEIRVSAARQGDEVVIEVEDDGAGFDSAAAKGLWEPFVQVQTGDRQREGTGLGLYICKGIVDHHGGRIWAESDGPGRGARFRFALPAHAASTDAASDGPPEARPHLPRPASTLEAPGAVVRDV